MLTLTTDATSEPLTTAEAKSHLRVTTSTDDTIIDVYIKAARRQIERITNRALINQTWKLWLDSVPYMQDRAMPWWSGTRQGSAAEFWRAADYIELGKSNVSSITSIVSYALDNTSSTFAAASYTLDDVSEQSRVYLNDGYSWPTSLRNRNAIVITFVAGYGSASSSVPSDILVACRMLVSHLYEHRGDDPEKVIIPAAAMQILEPYIVRRLG